MQVRKEDGRALVGSEGSDGLLKVSRSCMELSGRPDTKLYNRTQYSVPSTALAAFRETNAIALQTCMGVQGP